MCWSVILILTEAESGDFSFAGLAIIKAPFTYCFSAHLLKNLGPVLRDTLCFTLIGPQHGSV